MLNKYILSSTIIIIFFFTSIHALTAQAFNVSALPDSVMSPKYWEYWNDSVQQKIDANIEKNRKANASIHLCSVKRNSEVFIEQVKHSFLFGGNIFMFGNMETSEKNKKYEDVFGSLFNAATVPFYWKTLEPVKGQPRYEKNSSYTYRRPPTDPVVDFCESKNINMNGHALIYGLRLHGHPEWMPEDRKEMETIFHAHIKEIAKRYGNRIRRWDIVNESIDQANRGLMPDDYTYKSFKWAMEYFPKTVQLGINDCDIHWGPTKRYVEIIRDLIDRGGRIDNVGVQMHIFDPKESQEIADGDDKFLTPAQNYAVLDCLKDTERPVHISEVTVGAPDSSRKGEYIQAFITKNLYRLWFSYPNVEGITWWNVVDGSGAKGEPQHSGIYYSDMTPKPVFYVLNNLINHEWKTILKVKPDKSGKIAFRGFKGLYRMTWKDKQGKKHVVSFNLNKDEVMTFE